MRNFAIGFVVMFLLLGAANIASYYVRTDMPGAYDAIRRAGFPFLVWEDGGFVYRHSFSYAALFGNIVVAACLGLGAGVVVRRVTR